MRRPPRATLLPYTTLFRSAPARPQANVSSTVATRTLDVNRVLMTVNITTGSRIDAILSLGCHWAATPPASVLRHSGEPDLLAPLHGPCGFAPQRSHSSPKE